MDTHYEWKYQQQLHHEYAMILICETVKTGLDLNLKDTFYSFLSEWHVDPVNFWQAMSTTLMVSLDCI